VSVSLIAIILMIQFAVGIYRLKWGIAIFIFIFVVFPTDILFLDFFSLNFIRASIVLAFFNVLHYHYVKRKILFFSRYKSYFYSILIFTLFLMPSFTSAQFSEGGTRGIYLYFTYYFIEQFLPGIIIMFVIETELDFYFYVKCILCSVLCMCLFGFYEYYTDDNPLQDWLKTVNTGILVEYAEETRFGFSRRVQSTSWHPIAYGSYLSMYIILFFIFIIKGYKSKVYKKTNLYFNIVILMSIANIVLTASRAPWLCTLTTISLILVINFKFFMRRYFVLKTMLLILITPVFLYFVINLLSYVMNSQVSGSSLSMRFDQFSYIANRMGGALYIGYGPTGIEEFFKTGQFGNALGFESIIFVYLVDFGLIGLIGLIFLYYRTAKSLGGRNKSFYTSYFYVILISHLIFVVLSGELRTFRIFWMLYSMIFIISKKELLNNKLQTAILLA